MSPHGAIHPRNYDLLPSKAIMPRFHKSANGFSNRSLAHAQATGRRENAGAVWLVRARHEAIRARLGSIPDLDKQIAEASKKASPRRPMENGSCCDFRENRAREATTASSTSASSKSKTGKEKARLFDGGLFLFGQVISVGPGTGEVPCSGRS